MKFASTTLCGPSAKARPNEIAALFAALAHSPESPSFSAMAKNIGLQLVVFDRRAVNFLLCDSFESIKSICHPHWFLMKRSKVGRAWDVDRFRRIAAVLSSHVRIGEVEGVSVPPGRGESIP